MYIIYETTATTSQQSHHVTGKVKVFRDLSSGACTEAEVLRALHEVVCGTTAAAAVRLTIGMRTKVKEAEKREGRCNGGPYEK